MTKALTNEELKELLDFISGKGIFSHLSGGVHTYPISQDEDHRSLFAACIQLENMQLVYRFIDQPDHVCFKAIPEKVKST